MTEAKNSMTFYVAYGMKETCTEARREDATGNSMYNLESVQTECDEKDQILFLCLTYQYPWQCVDVRDLKEEPNCVVSQEDVL